MRISQFHPAVHTVPCHYCRELVGVDGSDERWNEDIRKPAHRLCANSVMPTYVESICYDAPLTVRQLQRVFEAIKKGLKFTDAQKAQTKRAIIQTIKWLDDGSFLSEEPIRSRVYACRLLAILSGRLGCIERGSLSVLGRPTVHHTRREVLRQRARLRGQDISGHRGCGGQEAEA